MYTPDSGDTIGQGLPPRRNGWPRWLRTLVGVTGAFILIGIGAAIGGSAGHPAAAPAVTVTAAPAASASGDPVLTCQAQGGTWDGSTCDTGTAPSPSATGTLTGPLGTTYTDTTQDPSGNDVSYDVTAVRVADPATGANEAYVPDPGKRFVGVEFRIKGDSGYSSDDANTDAVLTGDNGQTYQADFSDISEGTNFSSGQFGVTAGKTQTGWVTFQVPKGVKVASVQWQPVIATGQPAEWDLG